MVKPYNNKDIKLIAGAANNDMDAKLITDGVNNNMDIKPTSNRPNNNTDIEVDVEKLDKLNKIVKKRI